MLSSPATARKGNMLSAVGMLLGIVVTLLAKGIDYKWIAVGMVVGSLIGVFAARLVAMTRMPEMVALFNGFGGIAQPSGRLGGLCRHARSGQHDDDGFDGAGGSDRRRDVHRLADRVGPS